MALSSLIAKIISIVYITAGLAIFSGTINLKTIVKDFEKSPALTFVSGCVGIIFGLVLIEYHNIWVKDWRIIITLIAWACLLGGITVTIFPKSLNAGNIILERPRILGILMITIGILFGYIGF